MTKKAANAVRCPPSISGPRALNAVLHSSIEKPFALERPQDYLRWREKKLARYPKHAEELIVEVRDPRALRDSEAAQIRRVCAVANIAVYASPLADLACKDMVRHLGERLGLVRPHANPLADEDGITSLEVTAQKSGRGYIPYSNRRLLWHTDGYYNAPESRIRAFLLHCVRPAAAGGENRVLDPEIAYILLRDADPRFVAALSAPDAMTVPANEEDPVAQRAAQAGPVFSFDDGALHMRYTARTRSIVWRADAATQAAVERLREILDSDSPYVFRLRLSGGQGLVCNNVLHDRSEFTDAPDAGRLVYRARYSDRIAPA
jgi:alpha-ketoglutarate-dependent taurine dioxygenase